MPQNYIGERFGDYKLVQSLGEGGFASVYLGEEVHEGTPAAVKLLKEQEVHNFINEVRNTFRLHHPNIVNILDFNIRPDDNTAYIVMEYAPNGSFRDKYSRGTRVPLDIVVPTVKQVAAALQYAHEQRVIHRDVKPENLLLNARNQVLLSDFGIATASRTTKTANAGQGDIIGTYAYMAPEQLKGRPARASDQYSLGIMVYEWLCGELPFEGREYIQWHYLHEKEPPPPLREQIPSLSPAVEQVVLRALAKKSEERFERVEMFALALEQAARGGAVPPVINARPLQQATQFEPTPPGNQVDVFSQTRLEQDLLAYQRQEQANLAREQLEQQRRERERLERERLTWEKQEQERLELEKQEQIKADKKRLEDERLNRVMVISAVVGGIVGVVGGVVEGGNIGGGSIGGFTGGVTGGRIIGGILGIIIGLIVEFVAGIFIEACGGLFPGDAPVGVGAGLTFGLSVGAIVWLLLGGTIGLIAGGIVGLIVLLVVRAIVRSVK